MPDDSIAALAAKPVLFVLKGYPRLSETFIAQEIRALEARGLNIRIAALRRPTDRQRHDVHREIRAPITYLPEYLLREPWRVLRAWWQTRSNPRYGRARQAWLRDLRRDPTPGRIRRFGQALVLARELAPEVGHLHAHFIHTPASVVRYASLLTGLRWSCSAHAKDIWTTPDWDKQEKAASADWIVACTAQGRDHLAALAPDADKVRLVYHGLDLERFAAPNAGGASSRDGSSPDRAARIVSVGRAVPKKGYDTLLRALSEIPAGRHWRLTHIGGGPLLNALQRQGRDLGIADRIAWLGPRGQAEVLTQYRQSDIFVLASRVAADGDRDGLPNVLMEAQSQGLAVVATALPSIAELILNGETGILVPPSDSRSLSAAIESLIASPANRRQLGAAGLVRLRARFDHHRGIDEIAELFGLASNHDASRFGTCASPSTRR